jgi:hypothetical protein
VNGNADPHAVLELGEQRKGFKLSPNQIYQAANAIDAMRDGPTDYGDRISLETGELIVRREGKQVEIKGFDNINWTRSIISTAAARKLANELRSAYSQLTGKPA